MPKAHEVAAELRRIADHLDLNPEVDVKKPALEFTFWSRDEKETFIATARVLPRPLKKNYPKDQDAYSRVSVEHDTLAVRVVASIYRHAVCILVKPAQPAEYDCELTLLDHEDAALTEA